MKDLKRDGENWGRMSLSKPLSVEAVDLSGS